jgi:4-amino-4-deoxy-L-arabinose transferase-like glycosyltransferase
MLRIIPIVYLELSSPGWHEKNINEIEFYYDDVARSLIAGKGFVHSVNPRATAPFSFSPGTPFSFVPPLYAWLLFIPYKLFGPKLLLAKIFQSMIDGVVCLLLYLLGKRLFNNNRTALLASLLYAIYPLAILMCSTLYYQIPMNVALCWLLLSFMAPITTRNGAWTGVALGVTSLAKPVTLPLIAILPIVKFVEAFREQRKLRPAVCWTGGFFLLVALTLAPWTIRNYMVFNELIPVQKGAGAPLLQGSKEGYIDLDVATLRAKYGTSLGVAPDDASKIAIYNHINHFRQNPLDYLRFLGKKFLLSWYNTEGKKKNPYVLLMQLPFLLLAVLSMISSARKWAKKPNWYILAVITFICGIQVIFFPLARYTLVVMPLVMLLAADGIELIYSKIRSRHRVNAARYA